MNGEELPPDHGFPLRLVVPGWIGIASIKWLGRIEVGDTRLTSPWNTRWYRMTGPGYPAGSPPLAEQPVKSAFELAWDAVVPARTVLHGRSWSGRAPVRSVEVSTDGGTSWRRRADARPARRLGPLGAALARGALRVPRAARAGDGSQRPDAARHGPVQRRRLPVLGGRAAPGARGLTAGRVAKMAWWPGSGSWWASAPGARGAALRQHPPVRHTGMGPARRAAVGMAAPAGARRRRRRVRGPRRRPARSRRWWRAPCAGSATCSRCCRRAGRAAGGIASSAARRAASSTATPGSGLSGSATSTAASTASFLTGRYARNRQRELPRGHGRVRACAGRRRGRRAAGLRQRRRAVHGGRAGARLRAPTASTCRPTRSRGRAGGRAARGRTSAHRRTCRRSPPAGSTSSRCGRCSRTCRAPSTTSGRCGGLLAPDGMLLISTVNANSLTLKAYGAGWGGFTPNHLVFFSPATLPRCCARRASPRSCSGRCTAVPARLTPRQERAAAARRRARQPGADAARAGVRGRGRARAAGGWSAPRGVGWRDRRVGLDMLGPD